MDMVLLLSDRKIVLIRQKKVVAKKSDHMVT